MLLGYFLKNIIYGIHTVNSKGVIWEETAHLVREKRKGKKFAWAK